MNQTQLEALREVLKHLNEGQKSWKAADPAPASLIFGPADHAGALDPERAIVVGNRGVGKSFWSSVLAHSETRAAVSRNYPRLNLDRLDVCLGFHEGAADGYDADAPSNSVLDELERLQHSSLDIWRGVLLEALRRTYQQVGLRKPQGLAEAVKWLVTDRAAFEHELRIATAAIQKERRRFVLLFDALDRLGDNWEVIRRRTEGLLRLALQMRSSSALRCKLFIRPDQYADQRIFSFPDASKLQHDAVSLIWRRKDLYGLLYHRLWADRASHDSFRKLLKDAVKLELQNAELPLPRDLGEDEDTQATIFYSLAGEFMGAGPTKGRTYSWLHDHLGDASGETSPRSFMAAIAEATSVQDLKQQTPLVYKGLLTGVQKASEVRLSQLKEDYWWVELALEALGGLLVPSEPTHFIDRWRERKTAEKVQQEASRSRRLPPVLLADNPPDPEEKLLKGLIQINVMERRATGKINMPDIFRVAANIKRKGGVRPPTPPGRR
ncbi:MAG: hypothetical protein ACKO6N_06955 [Myxococcota bacterium]